MNRSDQEVSISSGTLLRAVLLVAACALIIYLRDILLILLTAVIIASAIEPATQWFKGHGFPRIASVLTIYLSVAILAIGFSYLFLPSLISETRSFVTTLPEFVESISASSSPALSFIPEGFSIEDAMGQFQSSISNASGSFVGFISTFFGGIFSAIVIVVLSFYLAVQDDGVAQFLKVITPPKHEAYVIDLWGRSRQKIGKWLQGQLLLSLFIGILVYIGLLILGVPNALTLALIAGVAELIPLFGPTIAAVPAVVLAATQGGVSLGLLTVGLYFVIQQFENNVIVPQVMRKAVGVSPIVVILSLLVGAKLFGFIGLLISIPLAATLMEFISDIEKKKKDAKEVLEVLE